jgi:hypothetical protein
LQSDFPDHPSLKLIGADERIFDRLQTDMKNMLRKNAAFHFGSAHFQRAKRGIPAAQSSFPWHPAGCRMSHTQDACAPGIVSSSICGNLVNLRLNF